MPAPKPAAAPLPASPPVESPKADESKETSVAVDAHPRGAKLEQDTKIADSTVAPVEAPPPPSLHTSDVQEGEGEPCRGGQTVVVRFSATLLDGTRFASTPEGAPVRFRVGDGTMIRGLEEGLIGMRPGGVRKVTVPAFLGYGQRGIKDPETGMYRVPPGATLVFDVELVEIAKDET